MIALNIDDDVVPFQTQLLGGFGYPVGTRGMIPPRHNGLAPKFLNTSKYSFIIRSDMDIRNIGTG